jgi:hypothetical protein
LGSKALESIHDALKQAVALNEASQTVNDAFDKAREHLIKAFELLKSNPDPSITVVGLILSIIE